MRRLTLHHRISAPLRVSATATTARFHGRARRGVVAVEAALVMTVVVLLMMGVWQVGQMLQVSMILYDAASEGARYAAGGCSSNTPVTVALGRRRCRTT